MTFGQFARNNVLRDRESYAAYWLSSIFTVVIFFVFSVDRYHPELKNGGSVEEIMSSAQVAILIFSLGFLTLSIFAFIRKKRRTYGTLLLMGMTRRQLRRMILTENLLIGVSAIAVGIGIGLVFGHLTVMLMARIIHQSEIHYVFPWQAVRDSVVGFLAVFAAVSYLQGRRLTGQPVRDLLSAGENESRHMSFHPVPAVLGVLLLISGYLLTSFHRLSFIENALPARSLVPLIIGSVCAGLYLIFREFLFLMLSRVRRRSKRYLRDGNAIWVSGLMDKLKSSVSTMFISTVMLTMAFSAIITFISIMTSVREKVAANNPCAFLYLSFDGNEREASDTELIETALRENGVRFEAYRYDILEYGEWEMRANKLIRASDYNHQTGAGLAPGDGEAVDISGGEGTAPLASASEGVPDSAAATVLITDTDAVEVVGSAAPLLEYNWRNHSYVVSDRTYEAFRISGKMDIVTACEYQADDEVQEDEVRAASRFLEEHIEAGYGYPRVFMSRITDIDLQEYTYELMGYVALLLSLIFIVASASLLYFRLVNDVRDNLPASRNLYRFGLSVPQILRLQKRQMLVLFLLPLGFGTLSTFFAMNFLINLQVASGLILVRAAVILVPLILLELGYFALLSRRFELKIRAYLAVE